MNNFVFRLNKKRLYFCCRGVAERERQFSIWRVEVGQEECFNVISFIDSLYRNFFWVSVFCLSYICRDMGRKIILKKACLTTNFTLPRTSKEICFSSSHKKTQNGRLGLLQNRKPIFAVVFLFYCLREVW